MKRQIVWLLLLGSVLAASFLTQANMTSVAEAATDEPLVEDVACDGRTFTVNRITPSATPFARGDLFLRCSQAVFDAIKKAFAMSGNGTLYREFGFAVLVNANGRLQATAVTGFEAERWQATVPASAVAIFHTHRDAVSPRPSYQDMREADRLQIPFFVISSQALWAYEPDPKKQGKGRTYHLQWH